jgi:hypothetical protein
MVQSDHYLRMENQITLWSSSADPTITKLTENLATIPFRPAPAGLMDPFTQHSRSAFDRRPNFSGFVLRSSALIISSHPRSGSMSKVLISVKGVDLRKPSMIYPSCQSADTHRMN